MGKIKKESLDSYKVVKPVKQVEAETMGLNAQDIANFIMEKVNGNTELLQEVVELLQIDDAIVSENNFQYNECKLALQSFVDAYQKYLVCKDKMEYKKASLLIHTDWKEALPFHNRPTVGDKEAYITETLKDKKQVQTELYLDKLFKEELYKIEVMRYGGKNEK